MSMLVDVTLKRDSDSKLASCRSPWPMMEAAAEKWSVIGVITLPFALSKMDSEPKPGTPAGSSMYLLKS